MLGICLRVGADEGYNFKQISLNDGLSQSTVRCVLTDQKGYIWIGTRSGLNRFDRYKLKSYFYSTSNPGSIPSNQINFLLEDKSGKIYVGTENGLVSYNATNDDFLPVLFNGKPLLVRSGLLTNSGLLLAGEGKLYNLTNGGVKEILTKGKVKTPEMFSSIRIWKPGKLLLATRRDGLWIYEQKSQSLTRAPFISDKEIMALYVDQRQRVWVAPYGQGLKGYDPSGKFFAWYNSANSAISSDVVLDMIGERDKLWIATDGGGISILDMDKGNFSVLRHIPGDASSLPESSILSLYRDKDKNLWAGSIRGGLILIRKAFLSTFREAPLNAVYGLSERTVLSSFEEDPQKIWVGTDGGGINLFNPASASFKHFPATYGLKVASITGYDQNHLLISAFSKGLYLVDKLKGSISPFHKAEISPRGSIISSSGLAVNLYHVPQGGLYLFTDKIYRYETGPDRFSEIPLQLKIQRPGPLLRIYSDHQNSLLFSPYALLNLNHGSNTSRTILELPAGSDAITAAARDPKGRIWIANRTGLMHYDPLQKKLVKITTNLFSEVSALAADSLGRLWIGAQGIVFLYQPEKNSFITFGESDGVVPNEFLYKPSLVSTSGDIYLGGVRGLLQIRKNIPAIPSQYPDIALMGLQVNGVPLNAAEKQVVDIPYSHNSLLLSVMAREHDVFRKKMFRYRIDGLDGQIIESYDHTLSLGSLPSGLYHIQVSCSLKGGGWSNFKQIVSIRVNPPWYRSFLFIASVIIFLAIIVVYFYRLSIAKNRRKLQWEMKEHEQRSYEATIRFLINISHELRTPLTLIYSPLQRMLAGESLEQTLRSRLANIFRQAANMKDIIDMVLDVRKIQLGEEKLSPEIIDFNEWVLSTAGNFEPELTERGIKLIYKLQQDVGILEFDAKKCALVLNNLLSNALKFSRPDSTVTISSERLNGIVRLSVADEGIGLGDTDMKQLFRPFYQGGHGQHGSGIGLSFAKILIDMHSGTIGAKANVPQGAVFYFELPITQADFTILQKQSQSASPQQKEKVDTHEITHSAQQPVLIEDTTSIASSFSIAAYSILIVEDQRELRDFLAESLGAGFKIVYTAENGVEALNIVSKSYPDIIVSDVMMPGGDGFELCEHLKSDISISHIPIILLTAQGDTQSRKLGYKLGADGYLSKPFDLELLEAMLTNLLRNREAIKARYKNSRILPLAEEVTFSRADELFMKKLNSLIADNLDKDGLDVEFLIDKMTMSRASLYHKLKNIADIGVNDYINKFRLERAAQLLRSTDMSIVEIAYSLGFNTQRYFSTVFRQAYGVTPTSYRQQNSPNS
ncbi:hybrid sensor histidine kinase/response regulator transcription factor [Pedobacter rhizosphaerae]|uniref:histidine kinase n=1 Tax=Pedobacter rhizosphaerae TaxID=390241 RepID=A0A1H9T5F3_9SPHI|nr:two-component regulator propeller domain-containing protein [Pedobacter rhizosphaerae]SER91793.1 Signal transduction histidine kinase [Pedobacter rhizosphaerae]